MGGISAYYSAKTAKQQGKNQQAMANYNAAVELRNAEAARMKAKFESKRQAEAGAREKSRLTAKLGAAGGLSSPVAGDLAAEQAGEIELENLLIGYEGEIQAQRHESQAALDIMEGEMAKKRGKAAARASMIGLFTASKFMGAGGSSMLTGFGGKKGTRGGGFGAGGSYPQQGNAYGQGSYRFT